MIGAEFQVNERPTTVEAKHLLSILRSYGHAINVLVQGSPLVATADLPAAGAAQNGKVIVENAGGSTRNLIVYSDGLRTRYTGTNF